MSSLSRRGFLRRGAVLAGGLCALPSRMLHGNSAPSQRITVGIIGTGLMGSGHVRRLAEDATVEVLAVCDVDADRRRKAQATVEQIYARRMPEGGHRACAAYNDYRQLLARNDIDAVLIASCDHWHALQAVDAARAGKDIYCEKPVSITVAEGREIVQAVRRYGRVFQTGTQYRSIPVIRRVCQFVREGHLGKVKAVFTILDPVRTFIGAPRFQPYAAYIGAESDRRRYTPLEVSLPAEPVPEGLDWDLWVGPAPWRPYNRLYHVNPSPGVVPWSFCDGFGVVAVTWHLSHSTDVIQWALGMEQSGPVELLHPADGPYPTLTCRYANGTLLHFVDNWNMVAELYQAIPRHVRLGGLFGGVFVGERGWITSMSTGGPIQGGPPDVLREARLPGSDVIIGTNDHHANWLECVRSRRQPSCDEELGHRSASVGHLALIAHRLGRSLRWDPVAECFPDDPAANRLLARAMRQPWRI